VIYTSFFLPLSLSGKMRIRSTITLLVLALTTCLVTHAKSKRSAISNGNNYIKLQDAYTQRTLPGVRGAEPYTETHFVLIWNNKNPPETFYWRDGAGSWIGCRITKATKLAKENEAGIDYTIENIKLCNIKKGDLLEVMPINGGKYKAPVEIPQKTTNTLFFKTNKTNWLAFPVKEIKQKRDIAMP
jgi:hypothetical protein